MYLATSLNSNQKIWQFTPNFVPFVYLPQYILTHKFRSSLRNLYPFVCLPLYILTQKFCSSLRNFYPVLCLSLCMLTEKLRSSLRKFWVLASQNVMRTQRCSTLVQFTRIRMFGNIERQGHINFGVNCAIYGLTYITLVYPIAINLCRYPTK